MLQARFALATAGLERRLAVTPLPVAAPAAAATPPPPAHLAAFALGRSTLARLLLVEADFLGRAGIVILVRDRVLGHGLVGELRRALARFTRLAATAAATPASPAAVFALAVAARRLAADIGLREIRRLGGFADVSLGLFLNVGLDFGFGRGIEHVFVGLDA